MIHVKSSSVTTRVRLHQSSTGGTRNRVATETGDRWNSGGSSFWHVRTLRRRGSLREGIHFSETLNAIPAPAGACPKPSERSEPN